MPTITRAHHESPAPRAYTMSLITTDKPPLALYTVDRVNNYSYVVRLDASTNGFTSDENKQSAFAARKDAEAALLRCGRHDAYIMTHSA